MSLVADVQENRNSATGKVGDRQVWLSVPIEAAAIRKYGLRPVSKSKGGPNVPSPLPRSTETCEVVFSCDSHFRFAVAIELSDGHPEWGNRNRRLGTLRRSSTSDIRTNFVRQDAIPPHKGFDKLQDFRPTY